MLESDSDDSDEEMEEGEVKGNRSRAKLSGKDDSGCSWGMGKPEMYTSSESDSGQRMNITCPRGG